MARTSSSGFSVTTEEASEPCIRLWCQTELMTRRKPSPPVLAALVVAHVIVTTITWRDLSHRSADQLHGPKWVVASITGIQLGKSAVAR